MIDRAALRALCDGATPGPWMVEEYRSSNYVSATVNGKRQQVLRVNNQEPRNETDLDFIAAARTAIPDLLDALDARDAEIARLRARNELIEQTSGDLLEALDRLDPLETNDPALLCTRCVELHKERTR